MADTMFNIFGNDLTNRPHSHIKFNVNNSENGHVGKSGFSSNALTPAKKSTNLLTPRKSDPKKKTFLQNKGTSIQSCWPETRPRYGAVLQVYEDCLQPEQLSLQDSISITYTPPPVYDDELNLSNSGVLLSEEQIDNLVLGVPREESCIASTSLVMIHPSSSLKIHDILSEDIDRYLSNTEELINDNDFPSLF